MRVPEKYLAVIGGFLFFGWPFLCPVSAGDEKPDPETLRIARNLSQTRFQGWLYGSETSKYEINCVQFLDAVLSDLVPNRITKEIRQRIYIDNLSKEERSPEKLQSLIKNADKRIQGVHFALVDAGIAKSVAAKDAKPGDFVQYWMKPKNGDWFGHAAIIESVRMNDGEIEVKIYGAHKHKNGIGTSDFWLRLSGEDRRVFIARIPGP